MKDLNEKALVENQKNAANILVITTKVVILQANVPCCKVVYEIC